jgi:hypothetical protein
MCDLRVLYIHHQPGTILFERKKSHHYIIKKLIHTNKKKSSYQKRRKKESPFSFHMAPVSLDGSGYNVRGSKSTGKRTTDWSVGKRGWAAW